MHLEGYCQPHCFSSPSLTLNPSEIQDRDPHNRIMPMNVFYKWLICAAGKLTFLTVLPKFVVFCTFFVAYHGRICGGCAPLCCMLAAWR